jgi:hypothetical protein
LKSSGQRNCSRAIPKKRISSAGARAATSPTRRRAKTKSSPALAQIPSALMTTKTV